VQFQKFWGLTLVLALAQIATAQNPEKVRLVGVGTTSPLAVYSKWFQAFEETRPNLTSATYPPDRKRASKWFLPARQISVAQTLP
jgi:ABC-type phosphate transport system substrate-binding protein